MAPHPGDAEPAIDSTVGREGLVAARLEARPAPLHCDRQRIIDEILDLGALANVISDHEQWARVSIDVSLRFGTCQEAPGDEVHPFRVHMIVVDTGDPLAESGGRFGPEDHIRLGVSCGDRRGDGDAVHAWDWGDALFSPNTRWDGTPTEGIVGSHGLIVGQLGDVVEIEPGYLLGVAGYVYSVSAEADLEEGQRLLDTLYGLVCEALDQGQRLVARPYPER